MSWPSCSNFSSLGSIVGAGAEKASRRLDLLAALRHVLYSPDVAPEMREVDQLHPLVRTTSGSSASRGA